MAIEIEEKTMMVTQTVTELSGPLAPPLTSLSHHSGSNNLQMQENEDKIFLSLSHMPDNMLCTFIYITSFYSQRNS